jgi:hypothetical protein
MPLDRQAWQARIYLAWLGLAWLGLAWLGKKPARGLWGLSVVMVDHGMFLFVEY